MERKAAPEKEIVLLFIRTPVHGRVKTRLAGAIGHDHALELYKKFVLDVLQMLKSTARPVRICFYPPETERTIATWLGKEYEYLPQQGEDLGKRMEFAFRIAFSEGFNRVILIGSDIPDLTRAVISQAFACLDRNDAVLGPARDGGYYLIGLNRESFRPALFHGIPWSTPEVLKRTKDCLVGANRSFHLLQEWRDVDTLNDLKALFARNRDSEFSRSRTITYLCENERSIIRETGISPGLR